MTRSSKTMGPMVAHTSASRIRLWMRAGEEIRNDPRLVVGRIYEIEDQDYYEEIEFDFLDDYDSIGLVEFGNNRDLEEGKKYFYRIGFLGNNGSFSLIYGESVSTFSRNTNKKISFICGSCRHLYIRNANVDKSDLVDLDSEIKYGDRAFKSISESPEGLPDFLVMTGDQVYCDHEEGSFFPTKPAKSIKEYYDNYYRAYQQPYFSSLGSKVPFFMAMDDHEIKNDWHMDMILNKNDEFQENLKHYKNGLKSYLVYQASLSSVLENVNNLKQDLDQLSDIEYERNIGENDTPYDSCSKGLFYQYSHGPAKFFSLDVRAERYMRPSSPQMIGNLQQQALEEWLIENRSDDYVKFIISAVPVFPDTKNVIFYPVGAPEDKWGAYCEQRLNILDFIRYNNIKKVVFLSGDVHVSLFSKLQYDGVDIGVYSIISSGLTWPVPGLQRFNFDWKNLPEYSTYRGSKRVPDVSSRGKYKPEKLSKWKLIKTGHREHNYCRVDTNGHELTVRYYKARNGEEFERIKIDL